MFDFVIVEEVPLSLTQNMGCVVTLVRRSTEVVHDSMTIVDRVISYFASKCFRDERPKIQFLEWEGNFVLELRFRGMETLQMNRTVIG